ncbi:MAG: hypothetical protein ACM3N9_01000 [Syntrophothermus sp.]
MKQALLILLLLPLQLLAQEPVTFNESIRKGIYLSFEEFKANRPAITDSFELPMGDPANGRPVITNKKGEKSFLKNYWGYCDGQNFFIHQSGNYQLEVLGKYSVFEAIKKADSSAAASDLYILNYETGDISLATSKNILAILIDEPVMYKDFRRNGNGEMAFQYMENYNRKHPVNYPGLSETAWVSMKKIKGKFEPNGFYAEIFGNSFMISANYERMQFTRGNFRLYGRIGLGYLRWGGVNYISAPIGVNMVVQMNKFLGIEFGAGTSLVYAIWKKYYTYGSGYFYKSNFDPLLNGFLGVRFQTTDNYFFRAGFIPVFDFKAGDESIMKHSFSPWFGLSAGYSFKD